MRTTFRKAEIANGLHKKRLLKMWPATARQTGVFVVANPPYWPAAAQLKDFPLVYF
jgi:hypothetical protein